MTTVATILDDLRRVSAIRPRWAKSLVEDAGEEIIAALTGGKLEKPCNPDFDVTALETIEVKARSKTSRRDSGYLDRWQNKNCDKLGFVVICMESFTAEVYLVPKVDALRLAKGKTTKWFDQFDISVVLAEFRVL